MLGHPQYEKWFKANLRCSQATFSRLIDWIRHELPERYRRLSHHSFKTKVVVVLYFLGSDGGYRETAAAFGMSKSWCVNVISVLVGVLSSSAATWINLPRNSAEWNDVEQVFFARQKIPGVVDAVDGTLIEIQRPKDYDGFYNRNGDLSLNIQAVVHAKTRFMSVDIRPGSYSDKKISKTSSFGYSISWKIPKGCFLLGDAGYTLMPWLITPFMAHEEHGNLSKLQKNFNYKDSSTRMSVECAFGRLKERFRILKTVMNEKSLDQTTTVVTACFVLHNMFLYYNDGLFAIPNRRRDRNDQVQPFDKSESETNPFLRKTA
ncbi:hypothetical protein H257_02345 [Aphanomyces astaci]|uniref:DDE Tnp4 domain-containing protein n=1 Tax=Aphanomyces astaci TaxID=112090 RepID=W4H1I6_APHAT|nr:hypothetical protein H257_02345 [Aphanomyces astaci]ETV85762.1 hypothetical protein H257_02345 [Aphanomyces astaci]|eukprot:XP_009824234.1 hypothetical protein H257_02345 [Aphanomyces astaci]